MGSLKGYMWDTCVLLDALFWVVLTQNQIETTHCRGTPVLTHTPAVPLRDPFRPAPSSLRSHRPSMRHGPHPPGPARRTRPRVLKAKPGLTNPFFFLWFARFMLSGQLWVSGSQLRFSRSVWGLFLGKVSGRGNQGTPSRATDSQR